MLDKRVVITGAAHGIGRAVASAFGRSGARLVLLDIDGGALETARRELSREGYRLEVAQVLDVGDREAYADFARSCGPVDVLVNNAGVVLGGSFAGCSLDDWDWVYRTNLLGVIHGCHYLVPGMIARGFGHVVNIASAAGLIPLGGIAAYSATKHAVVGFSGALARELEPQGVHVCAICPSAVSTGISRRMRVGCGQDGASARERAVEVTRGSDLAPEQVARAVLNAVERRRRLVLVGSEARLLDAANRLSRSLARRIVAWAEKRLH
jgi:short-subunit dehydrogenase